MKRIIIYDSRMYKVYNRSLLTLLHGKLAPVHLGVVWTVGNSPDSRANKIYSPTSDKLTEVQLYFMSTRQPGRVTQSVGHLNPKSGILGSIPGLATYFRFSFRFFKKGSCQLLAKVCALSTG